VAAKFSVWQRRLHRWGAILIAAPLLVIIATGILLQLKKHAAWIQPPERKGEGRQPAVSFDRILEAARGVPEAEVRVWEDIDRLDVRPSKGMLKVQARNRWEIQLDARTGDVLQIAYRRSDLIESLHDGSFFFDGAKLWIFLPAGIALLGLWLTGAYLFALPYWVRWRRARRAA
jgi:uncharacterized iron-regulated membrane protein